VTDKLHILEAQMNEWQERARENFTDTTWSINVPPEDFKKVMALIDIIRDLAAKEDVKIICPKCGSRYATRSGLNIQCSCGYIIAKEEG
jgi:hypothetical protein